MLQAELYQCIILLLEMTRVLHPTLPRHHQLVVVNLTIRCRHSLLFITVQGTDEERSFFPAHRAARLASITCHILSAALVPSKRSNS